MLNGKRILVLGGTAYIGRAFCRALIDRTSAKLTLLNRGQTNPNLFPKLPRILCDREDREACTKALHAEPSNEAAKNGVALQDVACTRPGGVQKGTVFRCTAAGEAGERLAFDALIDAPEHIVISPAP